MEPLRSYEPDTETCAADRRASRRVRVTCPATLQTMTTMTEGTLGDISETGAQFEADEPPGKGATAVLKWGSYEAVCTIIWHDDGACGVWFKQPLSAEVVAETAALDKVLELPIASVGNISQGRKRSMDFLKRAPVAEETAQTSAIEDAQPVSSAALPIPGAAPPRPRLGLPAALEKVFRSTVGEEQAPRRESPAKRPSMNDVSPQANADGERAFGRAGGLPPSTIGHSESLAEVLRRYRQSGSWER